MEDVRRKLAFLGQELVAEILSAASVEEFPKGMELLREDQYVKVIPLVLEGLVKVYSRFEERELLLYYIQPNESCVMSFSASINNEPSKVFAVTEEPSKILLIPVDKLPSWIRNYPSLNHLFFQQYNRRYTELLDTIQHVLLDKMDKRLHDYLLEKSTLTKQTTLKLSHQYIANELGTVREVISRVMKKLETEGKVQQIGNSIKIFK